MFSLGAQRRYKAVVAPLPRPRNCPPSTTKRSGRARWLSPTADPFVAPSRLCAFARPMVMQPRHAKRPCLRADVLAFEPASSWGSTACGRIFPVRIRSPIPDDDKSAVMEVQLSSAHEIDATAHSRCRMSSSVRRSVRQGLGRACPRTHPWRAERVRQDRRAPDPLSRICSDAMALNRRLEVL